MFCVYITPQAKALLDERLHASGSARPGVLVHRAVPAGATLRLAGESRAFVCQIACFESYPDAELLLVEGVHVYLALMPRRHEKGVRLEARGDAISAEGLP